jgi:amino acid adenylation domain-containing protein
MKRDEELRRELSGSGAALVKKMKKENILDIYALTPMQEGMLFHYLKDPGSDYYFEQLSLEISGKIDHDIFEKSWNFVVETDEMLRTVFRWENLEMPVQVILKHHKPLIIHVDISGSTPDHQAKELEALKNRDRKNNFDLREVPFRVMLYRLEKTRYVMIISNHHILYDGWSSGIILDRFFGAYADIIRGNTPTAAGKKFSTYIKYLQKQDEEKQAAFWKDYLAGLDTPTVLSVKGSGGPGTGPGSINVPVSNQLLSQIEGLAQRLKITGACLWYCSWGILLQEYNNCEDVVFGTTVSGRPTQIEGIEHIVGLFINTIPLRVRRQPAQKAAEMLTGLNHALQEREPYENTPLVNIITCSGAANNRELFDNIMVIENYPLGNPARLGAGSGMQADFQGMRETTHYDLTVVVREMAATANVTILYRLDRFEELALRRLGDHFLRILAAISADTHQVIAGIEMMSAEEKRQILEDFNDTRSQYRIDRTVHQLYSQQVQQGPDCTALSGKQITGQNILLSFCELEARSGRLAGILQARGVRTGSIVAIMVGRNVEAVISILAIFKTGAAYLPIDPGYPGNRIDYMLKDSRVEILLTTGNIAGVMDSEKEMIYLESTVPAFPATGLSSARQDPPSTPAINPAGREGANCLAYIIYTSGSTGRPRGVVVTHRSLVNFVWGIGVLIRFKPGDVIFSLTTICFDIFGLECFMPLVTGGKMVIGGEEEHLNVEAALGVMEKECASIFQVTPSRLRVLMEGPGAAAALGKLNYLLVGGETFPTGLRDRLSRMSHARVFNMYGPTETTIWSSLDEVRTGEGNQVITIGKPIANTVIYIVGQEGHLVPPGVPGELLIGGDGVARGYLNRPGLTAAKFCLRRPGGSFRENRPLDPRKSFSLMAPHNKKMSGKDHLKSCNYTTMPFATHHSPLTLYHTGDLARWLDDGRIQYLGRLDFQVKVRGFRVELEEIQYYLLKLGGVKEAVAITGAGRDRNSDDGQIYAYVTGKANLDTAALRNGLREFLPDYMVPGYVVQLKKIPLTPNGKVNRGALPLPESTVVQAHTPPRSREEVNLSRIWEKVLGLQPGQVGIESDFFRLGGHSLRAMTLMLNLRREYQVKIPLTDIFRYPRLSEMAVRIKQSRQDRPEPVKPGEKKEYYPLSSAQIRMYVLYQQKGKDVSDNITSALLIKGDFHPERCPGVFRAIVRRQEALRTSFIFCSDLPVQRVHEAQDLTVEIGNDDLSGDGTGKRAINPDRLLKDFIRPFDLCKLPLFRVKVVKLPSRGGENQYLLLFDMHHIVVDGLSTGILLKEWMDLYAGETPGPLRVQYRDFTCWQHRERRTPPDGKQEEFWKREFSGGVPVLHLPLDYPRPPRQNFAGDNVLLPLEPALSEQVTRLAQENGVTLFIMLLTVFYILLWRYTGQEDIAAGTPVAGRPHQDLAQIIGMFVNMLALRCCPRGDLVFRDFLHQVRDKVFNAFENQDYQFDDLVERLKLRRDTRRSVLFDVVFTLRESELEQQLEEGIPVKGHKTHGEENSRDAALVYKRYRFKETKAQFDLVFYTFTTNVITLDLRYARALFKISTAENMARCYVEILRQVVNNPGVKLQDIDIFPHRSAGAAAGIRELEFGF